MIERKWFLTMLKIPFHDMEVIGRCHVSISSVHMLKCVIFLLYFFSDVIEKMHYYVFFYRFPHFLADFGEYFFFFDILCEVLCLCCSGDMSPEAAGGWG